MSSISCLKYARNFSSIVMEVVGPGFSLAAIDSQYWYGLWIVADAQRWRVLFNSCIGLQNQSDLVQLLPRLFIFAEVGFFYLLVFMNVFSHRFPRKHWISTSAINACLRVLRPTFHGLLPLFARHQKQHGLPDVMRQIHCSRDLSLGSVHLMTALPRSISQISRLNFLFRAWIDESLVLRALYV